MELLLSHILLINLRLKVPLSVTIKYINCNLMCPSKTSSKSN